MKNLHIIPGVSGSGKTTMGRMMEARLGTELVVPYTTRDPRQGEVDGHDYHFRDTSDFDMRMAHNKDGDWTFSKIGEHFYYNSTKDTLPNETQPVRVLPVSFSALQPVLDDYAPLLKDGIITIIPTLISPELSDEWLHSLQPLRPTRDLRTELDEQNRYVDQFDFDAVYFPSWDILSDAANYIHLYQSIINAKKDTK